MNRFQKAALAIRELGFKKVSYFALYRAGFALGLWRSLTPPSSWPRMDGIILRPKPIFQIQDREYLSNLLKAGDQQRLLEEADLILNGQLRFFSNEIHSLDLCPSEIDRHWTQIRDDNPNLDIKFIWEPARFGWVFTLGRAYQLNADPAFPLAFWRYFEQFMQANPLNMGPNWASGQEVALRLIALVFAWQVFATPQTSTAQERSLLLSAVVAHAQRIPPTLLYARAQNNNHLISEAAGLYTAGVFLEGHPLAPQWKKVGWKWLNKAWQTQIEADGNYIQQSSNYHRLMLQVSLVAFAASQVAADKIPAASINRLQAAAIWPGSLIESSTGAMPNLGHNDGSLFLPLSASDYADYRPTLQAACRAFANQSALTPGIWDELSYWLLAKDKLTLPIAEIPAHPHRLNGQNSWAVLRAAHYTDRPAHADQLHVDLWFRGQNIACDAGTYRYTAPPPWDHTLARTASHNTLTINNQDQMQRASRFLWLRWAQASLHKSPLTSTLTASHNGYAPLGITHSRSLSLLGPDEWLVTDQLTSHSALRNQPVILHWLLSELPWSFSQNQITVQLQNAALRLSVQAFNGQGKLLPLEFQLIRAGELLQGSGEYPPYLGWVSPTYSQRLPALSIRAISSLPEVMKLVSHWMFTD